MISNNDADFSQRVRCPNCGGWAERHYLHSRQELSTECPICDYFMRTMAATGTVIEAYAPGIWSTHLDCSMSAVIVTAATQEPSAATVEKTVLPPFQTGISEIPVTLACQ